MVTRSQTFARIARDTAILDGEPVIVGTRLPVRAVVLTHRYAPDAAHISTAYPFVTRASTPRQYGCGGAGRVLSLRGRAAACSEGTAWD